LYKYAGDKFRNTLLKFFNNIYKNAQIPNEWKRSITVPIYKKGDKRKPENYGGINLLNTCHKIFSNIFDGKLKNITQNFLVGCQNGFRKGRSCIDSAFCMKLLIEKIIKFNLETHFAFVDYEKVFDKVKRQKLSNILKEKNVPNLLLKNILEIYTNNTIRTQISNTTTEERVINQGVRQGCSLPQSYLYTNEIIEHWNEKYTTGIKTSNDTNLNTILLADDQVIANSKDNLQRRLHALHQTVQTFGMKISHQKIKIMAFKERETIKAKL
jgi:hypothetical protein